MRTDCILIELTLVQQYDHQLGLLLDLKVTNRNEPSCCLHGGMSCLRTHMPIKASGGQLGGGGKEDV